MTDMDVDEDGDDSDNDPNYIPGGEESEEDNSQIVGCGDVAMRPCLSHSENRIPIPEDFVADGSPQEDGAGDSRRGKSKTVPLHLQVKQLRNLGQEYMSEKSKKIKPARNVLKPRCESAVCRKRELSCSVISDERRTSIIASYFQLRSLEEQRQWIRGFVTSSTPITAGQSEEENNHLLPPWRTRSASTRM